MCMKNINTDILFFEDVNSSKLNTELLNIYGITKEMPEVEVEKIGDNMLVIPRISLMLSINATEKKLSTDKDAINFSKKYRICIRVTETSSGQCVDIVQFDIHPCDEELSLCRKIYNKKSMFRFENIIVAQPPKDKEICVFKVLIQEVIDGNLSEENWIAQSMHPVKLIQI